MKPTTARLRHRTPDTGDPSGLPPTRFGDSDKAQADDMVLAAGNLLCLSSSVTEGIISATVKVTSGELPGS